MRSGPARAMIRSSSSRPFLHTNKVTWLAPALSSRRRPAAGCQGTPPGLGGRPACGKAHCGSLRERLLVMLCAAARNGSLTVKRHCTCWHFTCGTHSTTRQTCNFRDEENCPQRSGGRVQQNIRVSHSIGHQLTLEPGRMPCSNAISVCESKMCAFF